MSNCKGCFHSTEKDEYSPNVKECQICIRNPEFASKRTTDRTVIIEGIAFDVPMDMYVTKDRMRYEDYMRMKKILDALMKKNEEEQAKKKNDPQPYIPCPNYPNYPNYPNWFPQGGGWQVYPHHWQSMDCTKRRKGYKVVSSNEK